MPTKDIPYFLYFCIFLLYHICNVIGRFNQCFPKNITGKDLVLTANILYTAYTILIRLVLGSKNESFFDPFDLTSMMLLLIVVYTNQKNFTAIILQTIQIIFLLNLLHCFFCGMSPLQLNN